MILSFSLLSTQSAATALRAGLIDIKPIELKERFKRFGITFTRVRRSFETTAKTDYLGYCDTMNRNVLSFIQVPPRFDQEKVYDILMKMDEEDYEQDTEFKKALKRLTEQKSQRSTHIDSLISFVTFLKERDTNQMRDRIKMESRMFLRSNLPLDLFSDFVTHKYTLTMCADNILGILKKYRPFLMTGRARSTFIVYQNWFGKMKTELRPVIDQMDDLLFSKYSLVLYLTLASAKTYDEIENIKYLRKESLDQKEYERLRAQFNFDLLNMRKFLFSSRYAPTIPEIKEDDPTTRMLGNILLSAV